MKPSVSVVIPSYNRRELTIRAVKSVLAQTWTDFEILVVDDGSDPEEVCSSADFTDSRIRLIRHPANRGISAARNTGVKEACADLIAFLDSDDRWLPDRLANQMKFYQQRGNQKKAFIYSSPYCESDNKWTLCPLTPWRENHALSDYLFLEGGDLHTSTWLCPRVLLQQFPFDEDLTQYEDYDVLLRMEAAGVEFVSTQAHVSVRNCDLRTDRISIRLAKAEKIKFLDRNRPRLTTLSQVIVESILQNSTEDPARNKIQNHLRFFMSSPQLNWPERLRLALIYTIRRVLLKVGNKLQTIPRPVGDA